MIDGNGDNRKWRSYAYPVLCGLSAFTSKYMCYNDGASSASIEKLITPSVVIGENGLSYRIRFDYKFFQKPTAPVETFYVNLVLVNQNITTRILELYGADSSENQFTYDITPLVSTNDTIRVEFVFNNAGGAQGRVLIDNVVIEGNFLPNNEIRLDSMNIILTSFPMYYFYPPDTQINYVSSVWIRFTNVGINNQSNFNFYLKVNETIYGPINYPGSLSNNQTDSVEFTNVILRGGWKRDTLKAWHDLSDEFPLTDTLKVVYSSPRHRLDTTLIYLSTNPDIAWQASSTNGIKAHVAVKYDSSKVWPFIISPDSYYITKVAFFHCVSNPFCVCGPGSTRISLWLSDLDGKPDTTKEIVGVDTSLYSIGFYIVNLPEPIKFEKSILPLFVGRSWDQWIYQDMGMCPFAASVEPLSDRPGFPGYANWNRVDEQYNGEWRSDSSENSRLVWLIGIIVQKKSSKYEEVILPNDARLFKSEFVKNGKLELSQPLLRDTRLRIYDLKGSVVVNLNLRRGTRIINIGNLTPGTYIYILDKNIGKIIVK